MSYATLANLKTLLSISDTAQDTYLQALLDAADNAIDNETGTTFVTGGEDVTETYDGNGTRFLQLRHRPVLSVTSVTVAGSLVDSTAYAVSDKGQIVYPASCPEDYNARTRQWEALWPRATANIEVVYSYGYDDTPAAIIAAALHLAAYWYRQQGQAQGAQSVSYGPASINFGSGASGQGIGIPGMVMQLIAPYKVHWVMG